jgi:hypothetical protein
MYANYGAVKAVEEYRYGQGDSHQRQRKRKAKFGGQARRERRHRRSPAAHQAEPASQAG